MNRGSTDSLGISIALATYNGENHILQQLESLAAQTRLPVEVVITDDGSTDRTLAIAADFSQKAPFPIKIFENETRLLFADNFLRAASLCSAPLIAFCDQDDVWRPEKLARSVSFFEDPEVLLSAHTSDVWDGEEISGKLYPDFAETRVHPALTLDPFELVPGFVMVLRRGLLHLAPNDQRLRNIFTLGGAPKLMGHDQWVWFLATIHGKVATISEPLALYRQHAANVVGAPKRSGWVYKVSLAIGEVAYAGLAELEGDAVCLVKEMEKHRTAADTHNLVEAIGKLNQRKQYHEARARIYDKRSGLFTRTRAFAHLVISGGYRNDQAHYYLGRRAGLKDLIFGVTGVYKMTNIE